MNAKTADRLATIMFYCGASILVSILIGMLGYILYHGLGSIDLDFITKPPSSINAGGGIGPQIFNSFYLLILTTLITVPVGLMAGIYLAEYAQKNKFTEMIRISIETLTSLPSIVIGLFGLLIFVNMTGWGYTLMSGALALSIINLPMIIRISEDAIRRVPMEYREGSYALGANKWQTIWRVVLPSAFLSLITGIIITSGRVFGEAAALLFTAGMSSPMLDFSSFDMSSFTSPLNPFRPAETLAVHIWKVNSEGLIPDVRRVADGSAAILVIIVLVFNLGARWMGRLIHSKLTGN